LIEVAPQEDNSQTNGNNPDHLPLERDVYRTPTDIERDNEFTDSCEGK